MLSMRAASESASFGMCNTFANQSAENARVTVHSGLTRAVYQHGGTVVECFDEPRFDQAGDDFAGCHCG